MLVFRSAIVLASALSSKTLTDTKGTKDSLMFQARAKCHGR